MEVVVTRDAGDQTVPSNPDGRFQAPSNQDNKRCTTRKLSEYFGAYEFLSSEMWRASITEMIATTSLLFTLTTTIIASLESHGPDPKFLVPIFVFVCAFLHLLVTIPISGGHMNPIFTFIAALKGAISWARALFYFAAQIMGSLICCYVLKGSMNHNTLVKYSLGGCLVDANGLGIGWGAAFVIEVSCTFLVLYVAVTVAFDQTRSKELGLPAVCVLVAGVYAMAVFISITITGRVGYGGVGLNPVRCLGPALLLGGPLWDMHWVFWIGPLCACLLYHIFTLTLPYQDTDDIKKEHNTYV